jgi:hypothetical protein
MDLREIGWGGRGGCRVDPFGSGLGPVAGSCKYGDEPAVSGSTEIVYTVVLHFVVESLWMDTKLHL